MPRKEIDRIPCKKKTTLKDFAPFLREFAEEYPGSLAVVTGGHAVNFWLEKYRERFPDPEAFRPKLGKDLDLLVPPNIAFNRFASKPGYEPPAIFVGDLLFAAARRLLLRQKITPFALWFIQRCGKVRVHNGRKHSVEVDFFAHTLGLHPNYVRKRAVAIEVETATIHIMDPALCLWQFIANAASLHQTRGDNGPRRRSDHLRCRQLIPITREYISALSRQGDLSLRETVLRDLALFLRREEAAAVRTIIHSDWCEVLPRDLTSAYLSKGELSAVEAIRKHSNDIPRVSRIGINRRVYPKPAPGFDQKLTT